MIATSVPVAMPTDPGTRDNGGGVWAPLSTDGKQINVGTGNSCGHLGGDLYGDSIVGRQDAWSPLAQHEEIAALIPKAWLTVIEDCGHMSSVEQPEAVAEALVGWLQTGPAEGRLARVS